MSAAGKIADQVRRIRRRKQLAKAMLTKNALPLRAGRWIVGPHFSRHASVKSLPPPLDGVKQWGAWHKGSWLRLLREALCIILPPWQSIQKATTPTKYVCDAILINRLKQPVGFDFTASCVVRPIEGDIVQRQRTYVQVSELYPCVPFEVDGTGRFVVEPMIEGVALHRASGERRLDALTFFFDRLVSAEARPLDITALEAWECAARKLVTERDTLLWGRVQAIIGAAKWTWTHGDLFAENIIMTPAGPVVIDYDKAGPAPSFSDVMTLAVFEARNLRPALLESIFGGKHDPALRRLGLPLAHAPDRHDREALFYAWLGWTAALEPLSTDNLNRFTEAAVRALNVPARG